MDQSFNSNVGDLLEQILFECLIAIDQGEPFDLGQVLEAHPEHAEELREFFDSVQLVEQMAGPTNQEYLARTQSIDTSRIVDQGLDTLVSEELEQRTSTWTMPHEFGRYRLLERLGTGAMGSVFRAHDARLGRDVAIKMPRHEFQQGSELQLRFEREAKAAAAIQHRNICPVYDVGEIDGIEYIAMSFLSGHTLAESIRQDGRGSHDEVIGIIRKLAEALAAAHKQNVIHRDLKPANVMIDSDQEPVIMDFGLALQAGTVDQIRVTQKGTIVGTPAYMAPEQIDAEVHEVGPRSDIYALGVIFYELLTGQLPFNGPLTSVVNQVLTKRPKSPRQVDPTISKAINSTCLKMLEKVPTKRFDSMEAIINELDQIETGNARRSVLQMAWVTSGISLAFVTVGSLVWFFAQTTPVRETAIKTQAAEPYEGSQNSDEPEFDALEFQGSLLGHSGPIQWIAYSPDGKKAASCSGGPRGDRTIRIWDLVRFEVEHVFEGHAAGVASLAFSPDGSRLVSADEQTGLFIWDVKQTVQLHTLNKTVGSETVVFLDEKRFCISSSRNNEIQIWNAQQGKLEESVSLDSTPRQIDYNQSAGLIAVALESGEIALVAPKGGASQKTFRPKVPDGGAARCVAFSADGDRVVGGFEKQIIVWDIESGQSHIMQRPRTPQRLAFTPDGQNLINISANGECQMFAVETGLRSAYKTPPIHLNALAISPDGKTMLCGGVPIDESSRDFAVQVIRVHTKETKPTVVDAESVPRLVRQLEGHTNLVRCLAFSPDSKTLASCGSGPTGEAFVRFWDVESGELKAVATGQQLKGIEGAFTPDGKRFLSASTGELMILWDVASGRELKRIKKPSGLQDVCVLTNRYACTVGEGDNKMRLWDLETGKAIKSYPKQIGGWSDLSHDLSAQKLLVANTQAEVKILTTPDFNEIARFQLPDPSANTYNNVAALSPDGKTAAISWGNDGLLAWDIATKKLLYHWKKIGYAICLRFSPDGRYLYRTTYPGSIHAFDTWTGKDITVSHAHMHTVAFDVSPNGKFVALGGSSGGEGEKDFSIQLWQLPKSLWPKVLPEKTDHSGSLHQKLETQKRSKESEVLVKQARELIQQRQHNQAAKKLEEAIKLDPQNAEAHYQRALCSIPWSDHDKNAHHFTSMRYLDKSIKFNRQKAEYIAERGLYLQKVADNRNDDKIRERAIADLTVAIQLKNNVYWWWFQRAWLRSALAEHDGADSDYRRVIELLEAKKRRNDSEQTHLAFAYLNNCDNLIRKGDVAGAMGMGDQAVTVAPGIPKAHWNRGRAYHLHHDYSTALESLDQAIVTMEGRYPDAFLLKTEIHDVLDEMPQARDNAAFALQFGGGLQAARALAAYEGALGRYDSALLLFGKVREATPEDAWAAYGQANALSYLGDFDGARASYADAVKLDPDNATFLTSRARLLRYLGQQADAKADERKARSVLNERLEKDENDSDALMRRAILSWNQGRLDESIEDWSRVVQIDPRDVLGLAHLALLLSSHPDEESRDGQRALQLAQLLTELSLEKRAFFLSVRAAAHAENGDWNGAISWQKKALDSAPLTEYADYAERLALYKSQSPFRMDREPFDSVEMFTDVVVPAEITVANFDALKPNDAPPQPLPPPIIAQQRPATVLIKSEQGFGTGMIVDREGYVLTCAHVLPYTGKVTIHYDDGNKTETAVATPIAIDHRHDLALLKYEPPKGVNLQTVQLGISGDAPVDVVTGSKAVVIGNPGDGQWVLQKVVLPGAITSERQMLGDFVQRPYIQVEANIAGGCSGGPLFDDRGRVIGIIVQKSPNLPETGFAVPMDVVVKFLGIQPDNEPE